MDAAFAHMVLHYVPSPGDVIREMARVVAPGGVLVIVDFVRHSNEWMKQELGVLWMGFEESELVGWLEAAGLAEIRIEQSESLAKGRDLPATFIASARVPLPDLGQ
jgi:SAM-dependent methyltransferase